MEGYVLTVPSSESLLIPLFIHRRTINFMVSEIYVDTTSLPLADCILVTLPRLGITTKFISSSSASIAPSPSLFASAIDDHTKAIYVESISNPSFSIAPIRELANIAHEKGIPLIVDNTFGMGGKTHPRTPPIGFNTP